MAIKERDVLYQGKENGEMTMDFPITKLKNVEGTAPVKASIASTDHIPIVDADDEMSKVPVGTLLDKALAGKLSDIKAVVIPTSGWSDGVLGLYTKYIDVSVSGILAIHNPAVVLDVASQEVALACGLCSTVESLEGKLRFRSKSVPESAMNGICYILGTVI